MIVCHGSDHIIENPVYGGGKKTNDYGQGFYMTESLDLAKEWACAKNTDGYANRYDLDLCDRDARRAYRQTRQFADSISGLYMLDIMREGIQNGNPRLR